VCIKFACVLECGTSYTLVVLADVFEQLELSYSLRLRCLLLQRAAAPAAPRERPHELYINAAGLSYVAGAN
jgi:hypothetical protein